MGDISLGRISKVSSFASKNERKLKFPTPLKKEIAHLYNPLCSTRTQTCIKSRIFGLVKIFLQDSACTFPSYCMHCCVCVRYTHVKSRGSFSSRLFHALLPLSLFPLSTAIAGTFLEKKRSVKIARILRFFSLFLLLLPLFKNCTSDYSSSKTGHQQTINRYLSKR